MSPPIRAGPTSGPATTRWCRGLRESAGAFRSRSRPHEGQYGADIGAISALYLTPMVKVFASYDGRFRNGYQAHAGTGGFKGCGKASRRDCNVAYRLTECPELAFSDLSRMSPRRGRSCRVMRMAASAASLMGDQRNSKRRC
jgi:hypothetical protein